MRPNFETERVELSQVEFEEMLRCVSWLNDGVLPGSDEEQKQEERWMRAGIADELYAYQGNISLTDENMHALDLGAVRYAVDHLSKINDVVKEREQYDRGIDIVPTVQEWTPGYEKAARKHYWGILGAAV